MRIFNYRDSDALGKVKTVDTAMVVVEVDDIECLRRLQVNRLAVLQSSRASQYLIGVIQKITRTAIEVKELADTESDDENIKEKNIVKITLIGTLFDKLGTKNNVFQRTLETVPEIEANCFALEGETLTNFMRVIADISGDSQKLSLGSYTLDNAAEAYLNGNKF
ncbi:ATPase, partial [Acinetobacter pittii]